jgi:CheY-like chemotaxis protein
MNILVVDDNATNRKLLLVTLGAEWFTVFEAGDGVEALAVLEREKIDSIISDILMPRMDGYRLCYEVRRNERFQNIPFIIFTSTHTSPSDEKFSLELGADRFVRKPAQSGEILRLLRDTSPRPHPVLHAPIPELAVLKEYSERLVAKLEDKNADLMRATDELRLERDFNVRLLDDFPTPVWRSDVDGKGSYFKRTWLEFTGRPLDEELGHGWSQGGVC